MPLPRRQTVRLRRGRYSEESARYFITACTKDRQPVLLASTDRILPIFAGLHANDDAIVHAATIMPDHVHLLLTLRARLNLGQIVSKMKSGIRRAVSPTWQWQEDFFEHRVRPNEPLEAYGLYIFMNPYRAGLLTLEQRWPGWFCPDESGFRFPALVAQENSVPVEWIAASRELGTKLRTEKRESP